MTETVSIFGVEVPNPFSLIFGPVKETVKKTTEEIKEGIEQLAILALISAVVIIIILVIVYFLLIKGPADKMMMMVMMGR